MSNYKTLIERLSDYFAERYPDINVSTDIFEHGFLRFLGYHSVPERCQFLPSDEPEGRNSFYIDLQVPYGISIDEFVRDLKFCAQGYFSSVQVEEIKSRSSHGFCVRLMLPYSLIKDNVAKLASHIDAILLNPSKREAYRYWTQDLAPYGLSLSIAHIEVLIGDIQRNFPSNSLEEIWNSVVKKASARPKNSLLQVLAKKIAVDKAHYPEIVFTCQIKGEKTALILTRDKIISALKDPISLYPFLIEDTASEFLVPAEIHSFVKEKYDRYFTLNAQGHYAIDLGYHYSELKILKKLGIKPLKSYRPMNTGERSRYYVYDKENYLQALIALKEIKGGECLSERLHQLKYSIRHKKWDQLAEKLDFLLNFATKTGLKIDYLELGLSLFDFAKETLEKEACVKTIEIIEQAFYALITRKVTVTNPKKLHGVLFKINLMHMNSLAAEGGDDTKKANLRERLFRHAQQASLAESNRFLAELCGFTLGDTLTADVNEDPLAVVVELAVKLKKSNEHLVSLRQKVGIKEKTVFFATALEEPGSTPSVAATASIELAKK